MSTPALNSAAATPEPALTRRDQSWRQQAQHRPVVNAYMRERYHQQKAGTWAPFTSTGPIREHLDWLHDTGMTSEQIAQAGGVSVSTLTRVFKVHRMTTTAADAILAVQPPTEPMGPDPTRQLQALVADGWSLEQLAEAAGINDRTAWQTVHGYATPSRRTIAAVEALYEQLRLEDPGEGTAATRSRLRGERHGWTTTTDPNGTDPQQVIDQVAVDRVVLGGHAVQVPLRSAEQQAALSRLAGAHPDDEIARRLGLATRTVIRQRASRGLPAYGAVTPDKGPAR